MMPTHGANKLEKLQRYIVWGGIGDTSEVLLGGLESGVLTPKRKEILGIKKLSSFNLALLGKWPWRFGAERDPLWRRVIYAKYGEVWGGLITEQPWGQKSISGGWKPFFKFSWFI